MFEFVHVAYNKFFLHSRVRHSANGGWSPLFLHKSDSATSLLCGNILHKTKTLVAYLRGYGLLSFQNLFVVNSNYALLCPYHPLTLLPLLLMCSSLLIHCGTAA
jgi:hypothetical protein